MPYLAPMDFTAWTGTAASVTLIQNNSTQVENSFIGAITLEGSGGPSQVVTAGSGSEFIYSGNILAWGISHMHKGTLLSVTDYNLYEGAAGKSYTPCVGRKCDFRRPDYHRNAVPHPRWQHDPARQY